LYAVGSSKAQLTVVIDREVYEALAERAKQTEERTLAAEVRVALRRYLEDAR